MFNLSGSEIVIILLLALVVLGPDKLPEAMRKAGRTWAELRKLSSNFQDEVRKGFEEPSQELRQTASAVKKAATLTASPLKGAVKSLLEPPATATITDDAVATTPAEPLAAAPIAEDAVAVTPAEPLAAAPIADESLVGEAAMIERAEVAVTDDAVTEQGAPIEPPAGESLVGEAAMIERAEVAVTAAAVTDDAVIDDAVTEQGATIEPPTDEVSALDDEAAASEPIAVEDAGDVDVTDDAVAPAGPSS